MSLGVPSDPSRDLRDVLALYGEIEALLARPRAELARVASRVSGWSADQHLAHVALANELVARNLKVLLRGQGALVVDSGDAAPEVVTVLEEGRLPRGRAQAPRIVRPPDDVDPVLLAQWVREGRAEFEELAPRAAEIAAAGKRVPHQLLGPLTAAQWARFAAVHTRHHLGIAAEVLAAR
jgi:hypothetical protein